MIVIIDVGLLVIARPLPPRRIRRRRRIKNLILENFILTNADVSL